MCYWALKTALWAANWSSLPTYPLALQTKYVHKRFPTLLLRCYLSLCILFHSMAYACSSKSKLEFGIIIGSLSYIPINHVQNLASFITWYPSHLPHFSILILLLYFTTSIIFTWTLQCFPNLPNAKFLHHGILFHCPSPLFEAQKLWCPLLFSNRLPLTPCKNVKRPNLASKTLQAQVLN